MSSTSFFLAISGDSVYGLYKGGGDEAVSAYKARVNELVDILCKAGDGNWKNVSRKQVRKDLMKAQKLLAG